MSKKIEDLESHEVDNIVCGIVGVEGYCSIKYSQRWEDGGPIVENFLIGSEGKSAWVWYKDRNYGIVGNSQLDACMKALILSRFPTGEIDV